MDDESGENTDFSTRWPWIAAAAVVGALLVGALVVVSTSDGDDNAEMTSTTTFAATSTTDSTAPTTEPPSATSTTPPTTVPPPPPSKTVEQVRAEIQAAREARLDPNVYGGIAVICDGYGEVGYGDVLDCRTEAWMPDGGQIQGGQLTVVIVDQAGRWASHGASDNPDSAYLASLPEMNCDQALGEYWVPTDPTTGYLHLLAYFFIHDQTPLMDIDGNGVPCETVVSRSAIDTVHAGGLIQ